MKPLDTIDRHFVDRMSQEFLETVRQTGKPLPPLPEPDHLLHIIRTVFNAGLLRDEGRPISIKVLYISEPPEKVKGFEVTRWFPFQESADFSVSSLKRLSAAAPATLTKIVLQHFGEGEYRITGLYLEGLEPGYTRFYLKLSPARLRPPPGITIASLESGKISISAAEWVLAEHFLGDSQFPSFGDDSAGIFWSAQSPLPNFWKNSAEQLFEFHPDTPSERREFGEKLLNWAFQAILHRLRDLGHGGTVTLSEEPPEGIIFDEFRMQTPAESEFLSAVLRERVKIYGKAGPFDEAMLSHDLDLPYSEYTTQLAAMAATDGILSLSAALGVFGFGGFVGDISKAEGTWNKGARHRSAKALCLQNPGKNLAILSVSQDGTITGFSMRVGDKEPRTWKETRLGLGGILGE